MYFLQDVWLVFQRQILLMWRTPIWIIVNISQPIFYLLLYAPLLQPALAPAGAVTRGDAYRIFVPGLLVLMAIFNGLFTGFGLLAELRAGVIERARVTPASRVALLLGRSLRDVVSILVQAIIVIVVAIPLGLGVHLGSLLLGLLLLGLLALMASAVSYGVSLWLRSEAALAPVMNTVAMPLAMLSGVMLPMIYAPDWLRGIAAFNPFLWAVDGIRALFEGGQAGDFVVWKGIGLTALLAVLATVWSARMFARSVR
jgi:ABC-2 type transport system permease protein